MSTAKNNGVCTRAITAPVHSIESVGKLHPDKRLIALSMPQNRAFHNRVTTHYKGSDVFRCKQLFTSHYELEFHSTGETEEFEVAGQSVEATVFQFKRIRQKRYMH